MKVYTVFTKNGKMDFSVKETESVQADSVMRNPLTDITEKLREMNDLSNRLTKKELKEVSEKLEKIEFIDVDGSKIILLKGGPGSGRHPEGGSAQGITGDIKFDHTRQARYDSLRSGGMRHNNALTQSYQEAYNVHGEPKRPKFTVKKGGPGSGCQGETCGRPGTGGSKDEFASFKETGHTQAAQSEIDESKKPGYKGPIIIDATGQSKKVPSPNLDQAKKVQRISNAINYSKYNVPFKHQNIVSSYVASPQFHADVIQHEADAVKEIKDKGSMQGKRPEARAIDAFLKLTGKK